MARLALIALVLAVVLVAATLGFAPPSAGPARRRPVAVAASLDDKMVADLSAYRKANGDTLVPHGYAGTGALTRWCLKQRQLKKTGKLAPAMEKSLNALKFNW